jgi:DNA-binding HxlR family transcriptional regulator
MVIADEMKIITVLHKHKGWMSTNAITTKAKTMAWQTVQNRLNNLMERDIVQKSVNGKYWHLNFRKIFEEQSRR